MRKFADVVNITITIRMTANGSATVRRARDIQTILNTAILAKNGRNGMAKLPTYEEMAKEVAEKALDEYIYKGKTLREWIDAVKQTRWIPVSERLPEDSGNYLIAIADSNYTNGQYYNISWFYPSNEEWSYRNAAVIAWMPLPKPYKAESEE